MQQHAACSMQPRRGWLADAASSRTAYTISRVHKVGVPDTLAVLACRSSDAKGSRKS